MVRQPGEVSLSGGGRARFLTAPWTENYQRKTPITDGSAVGGTLSTVEHTGSELHIAPQRQWERGRVTSQETAHVGAGVFG